MARSTTATAPAKAPKHGSPGPAPDRSAAIKQPLTATLGRYSALFLWAAFMVIFGIANTKVFLSGTTLRLTFAQGVVTAVVGLAFLIPLAAGVYDLSVGAQMGLSLVILSWFALHHHDVPVWLVAILAVGACCLVGLLSGLIVVKFKVNSLIATLGVSQVLTAATLKISDNQQIAGAFSPSFAKLGNKNVVGVPLVLIYLLVIAAIVWYVLEQTPAGRYLLATGANPEAARLAGLPVNTLTFGSLVASGGLAGIAGVIFAMQVGVYSDNAGPSQLFPALAAVFFGASQFSRRPNVWGTVVAYFALAFGVKGLQIAFGPGTFWIQPLFQGVALLVAVALASRVVGQTRRSRKAQETPPSGGVIDIDEPPVQEVTPESVAAAPKPRSSAS